MPNKLRALTMSVFLLFPSLGCLGAFDGDVDERAGVDCQAPALEVIVKGRENRFGLDGQQVALDPAIPIDRICQRVPNTCKATCADAKREAVATGVRGFQDSDPVRLRQMGRLADTFNARLGRDTDFDQLGADPGDPAAVVCNAKLLEVIVRDREHRFGFDGRQVALNPAIPMQNICQQVNASCRPLCDAAKASAEATGVRGFSGPPDQARLRQMGELADDFNAALGNQSDFASLVEPGAGGGGGGGAVVCNAKALQVIVKGKEHRFGFDNRQVALNPAIPMQNICQGVAAGCRATCDAAKAAAEATGVRGFSGDPNPDRLRLMGRLADTFNRALGISTSFEANPILQN